MTSQNASVTLLTFTLFVSTSLVEGCWRKSPPPPETTTTKIFTNSQAQTFICGQAKISNVGGEEEPLTQSPSTVVSMDLDPFTMVHIPVFSPLVYRIPAEPETHGPCVVNNYDTIMHRASTQFYNNARKRRNKSEDSEQKKQDNLEIFNALWPSDHESSHHDSDSSWADVDIVNSNQDVSGIKHVKFEEGESKISKNGIFTTEDMEFCEKLAKVYQKREFQEFGTMNHIDMDKCECKYCWIWNMHKLLEEKYPEVVEGEKSSDTTTTSSEQSFQIGPKIIKQKPPKIFPRSEFTYPFEDDTFDDRDSLDRFILNIRETVKSWLGWIVNMARRFWPFSQNLAKVSPASKDQLFVHTIEFNEHV